MRRESGVCQLSHSAVFSYSSLKSQVNDRERPVPTLCAHGRPRRAHAARRRGEVHAGVSQNVTFCLLTRFDAFVLIDIVTDTDRLTHRMGSH